MTKRDIVLKISQELKKADEKNIKQVDVGKVMQSILDTIIESLSEGKKVELRNFGVFKIKSRKPKKGRNPRTGELVPVPQRKVVVFKPGLVMKRKVTSHKSQDA